jgi:hypothetical protein
MESEVTTKTTITLKLNKLEASYLKGLVQNPLCFDSKFDPKDEGDFIRNMRQSFWNALSSVDP